MNPSPTPSPLVSRLRYYYSRWGPKLDVAVGDTAAEVVNPKRCRRYCDVRARVRQGCRRRAKSGFTSGWRDAAGLPSIKVYPKHVRVLAVGASFSAPINVGLRQLMVEHTAQLYWATNHIVILCILLHARPVIGIWADIYFLQNNCCY
jgi:hypothetical protein